MGEPRSPGQNFSRLSTVKSSPKFSFRPRTRPTEKQETPGPGAYSTGEIHGAVKFGKSASYSWGTSPRNGKIRETSPGPGAYGSGSSPKRASFGGVRMSTPNSQPEWGFGTQPRLLSASQMQGKDSPGPGAYVHPDQNALKTKSPRVRFGAQLRVSSPGSSQFPGPGAYEPPKTGTVGEKSQQPASAPQWRFGTDQRMKARLSHSPGPGEYNTNKISAVNETLLHRKSPRARFGTERRFGSPSSGTAPKNGVPSPGPGAYGDPYTVFGH